MSVSQPVRLLVDEALALSLFVESMRRIIPAHLGDDETAHTDPQGSVWDVERAGCQGRLGRGNPRSGMMHGRGECMGKRSSMDSRDLAELRILVACYMLNSLRHVISDGILTRT